MKLLAVGGGSGGHVTPVLAVINELSQRETNLTVHFVCDKAFESQSRGLMTHAQIPVRVSTIMAGKLRRYHNESWLQRCMDVRTNLYNIRDIFYIVAGFLQSLWLILRVRPDVVFAKGGYVCLPLGFAAHFLGCKLVIHDSDTRPGLTNRILARFADAIATGSPLENYSYPKAKSSFTGVPIDTAFHPFSASEQRAAKDAIGVVDVDKPLVVVTGGGLGAKSINDAMVRVGRVLIEKGIQVYHIAGKKHYEFVSAHVPDHPHYQVVPFVYKDMVSVLGAADLVVARASATFLQELAGLKKATIVIPAAQLGDQIKNAHMYQAAHATYVLTDAQLAESDILGSEIMRLLNHSKERQQLAENLYTFAKPEAAADLAKIIRNVIKRG